MPHFPKPWFRKQTGTWYVQISGRQVNLGRDEAEAFRRYHEIMARHRPEDAVSEQQDAPLAVAVVLGRFLAWVEANRAPATHRLYRERLQAFIDYLPNQRLTVDALRPFHVQEWVDGQAWASGTKRGRIMAIQTALSWAVRQGILERSPLAGMRKPGQGRRESPVTPEEWATIMASVRTPTLRDILIVAWETGARPQEVRTVERRHCHLDAMKWVFQIRESKGRRRTRVVYLTDTAAAICRRLCERHPRGPLFRNEDGQPWTTSAMNCAMCRLAGKIGRKAAFVDLRHGFGTRMLKAGVDPITVAALMGHTDPSMLAKVYSHVHQDGAHLRAALTRGAAT